MQVCQEGEEHGQGMGTPVTVSTVTTTIPVSAWSPEYWNTADMEPPLPGSYLATEGQLIILLLSTEGKSCGSRSVPDIVPGGLLEGVRYLSTVWTMAQPDPRNTGRTLVA